MKDLLNGKAKFQGIKKPRFPEAPSIIEECLFPKFHFCRTCSYLQARPWNYPAISILHSKQTLLRTVAFQGTFDVLFHCHFYHKAPNTIQKNQYPNCTKIRFCIFD